jgi:hypothetical protein
MTLINQYEQLRASIISTDRELHTSGYGVFLLRGMFGWIKAVPAFEPTPEEISEVSNIQPENYNSVVNVLANMVVCCIGGSL